MSSLPFRKHVKMDGDMAGNLDTKIPRFKNWKRRIRISKKQDRHYVIEFTMFLTE